MTMTIRSITQLPREENLQNFISGRMEMSLPLQNNSTRFCSKQIFYSDIKREIQNSTIDSIVSSYGLTGTDGQNLSLSGLYDAMNAISSEDISLEGKKKFIEWPYVSKEFPTEFNDDLAEIYGDNGEYILPNVKQVRKIVDDNSIFMSTTSSMVAEGNPLPFHGTPTKNNVGEPGALTYSGTIGSGKFYYWQIDNGLSDSSQSIFDVDSGSHDGYELIRDTGNLVVWGWLAENPENPPPPQNCWVAMLARMKCEGINDTQTWVPISVQPWIRGINASTLQYVSFNIPVKAGLEIKIKTGFPVFPGNSAFQEIGSLTFKDKGIPNAFFGYVIK